MISDSINQSRIQQCTVCHSTDLCSRLSFGIQPVSNCFTPKHNKTIDDDRYPLSLGYCQQCGTIQLVDRMPVEAIRPRYDWLQYNEPEGHLDNLAQHISELPGLDDSSHLLGITYKDKSTLDRINQLGFTNTQCIKESDVGISDHLPFGLETIQDVFSDESNTTRLKSAYGNADVVIIRHIIEHAFDANRFIRSLKKLLSPNGYMVCEVPDSSKFLRDCFHPFIWEEHICYFTEESFIQLAKSIGAEAVWMKRYSYPYEDSLVIALHFNGDIKDQSQQNPPCKNAATVLDVFSNAMLPMQEKWHQRIKEMHKQGKKIAIFGAGHLAVKFINFYKLYKYIDCVIDDHPKKDMLYMPGSRLPIVSSSELRSREIQVCISTLNPESENKVKVKLVDFINSKGIFISAFVTN